VILTQVKDFKRDQIEIIEKSTNSGAFGSVVQAKLKSNGKVVALKIIKA
jgi:serine/threonine protein kinase